MSGIQIADAKAPWIMFERRAVEDREATIREGRYMAKDVDFVLVTPHGSKDQFESEVSDWLARQEQQVKEGRLDEQWFRAYENAYKNWKGGKEIPLSGTPILNWPLVSPSQVRLLQDLHILTVESLAECNEEAIRRMGMGGRALKQKAIDFLRQANEGGKVVEELGAMRTLLEAQTEQLKALSETNAILRAQLQAQQPASGEPPAPSSPASIGAGDLLDTGFTKL